MEDHQNIENVEQAWLRQHLDHRIRLLSIHGTSVLGTLKGYDATTLLIEVSGEEVLIYRSAIFSIAPQGGTPTNST